MGFDTLAALPEDGPDAGVWVAGEAAIFHIVPPDGRPSRLITPFLLKEEPLDIEANLGIDVLLQEVGPESSLLFDAMPLALRTPLEHALNQRGWRLEPEEEELYLSRVWVAGAASMPAAAAPPLPVGYSLDSLAVTDADEVDENWHFQGQGTLALIQGCIEQRPSAGVRDCKGKLVSFAVVRHDGQIGCLGTLASHRSRGLARAVVHRLITEQPGLHEIVQEKKAASQALCRKMGLEPVGPQVVFMRALRDCDGKREFFKKSEEERRDASL